MILVFVISWGTLTNAIDENDIYLFVFNVYVRYAGATKMRLGLY